MGEIDAYHKDYRSKAGCSPRDPCKPAAAFKIPLSIYHIQLHRPCYAEDTPSRPPTTSLMLLFIKLSVKLTCLFDMATLCLCVLILCFLLFTCGALMYQSLIYSCVCQCSSVFCLPQLLAQIVSLPGSSATVACLACCARQPSCGQVLCQHPVVMVAQQAA